MRFEVQSPKGLLPLPLPGEGLVHYQVSGAHTPLSPPPPHVSPTYQNPIIFSDFNVVMSSLPRRIYGNLVLRDLIQILDVADNSGPMTMGGR